MPQLNDVGFCLMVATMLHSVATGNILPASIPLVCVDINPATVTKLADRGSSQARRHRHRRRAVPRAARGRAGAVLPAQLTRQVGGPDQPRLGAEGSRQQRRYVAVPGAHERPQERGARRFQEPVARA